MTGPTRHALESVLVHVASRLSPCRRPGAPSRERPPDSSLTFCRAVRVGSFSSAGRDLGLSQPSASRLIAALGEELGATLFSRTTLP
jgi:Bacterial regulatory helix-turn-helix protein, lysR family